jgi:long-subunit fatty acid transport protein
MARLMTRIGFGTLGLLAGLGAPRLAAQSWALPASDPVGIARGGTGVAYGNSLEAAALNPALLATLRDGNSAYVAVGLELQAAKTTLQANQIVQYSVDRNRFLPALGANWSLGPALMLGLKIDEPFLRHVEMPANYAGRFNGEAFNLDTHRMEAQLGWAITPNWAAGASLGVTQIQYSWDNMIRTVVENPNPLAPPNSPMGLMESDLRQKGSAFAPSYSLGFRWAPNSRWTVAGVYVGSISATLPLRASYGSTAPSYYGLDGVSSPQVGTSQAGAAQRGVTQLGAGRNTITLPGKVTVGVRQRVNQLFTWEMDLRYVLGSQTVMPGMPSATVPGASPVSGPGVGSSYANGLGLSVMGELNLTKRWVVRLGASMDPSLRTDNNVEPLIGGAKTAGFSGGFGWKVFGGQVNAGYQYRQSQNVRTPNLQGSWPSTGYAPVQGTTQVEGMGHLLSIGYKRSF